MTQRHNCSLDEGIGPTAFGCCCCGSDDVVVVVVVVRLVGWCISGGFVGSGGRPSATQPDDPLALSRQ